MVLQCHTVFENSQVFLAQGFTGREGLSGCNPEHICVKLFRQIIHCFPLQKPSGIEIDPVSLSCRDIRLRGDLHCRDRTAERGPAPGTSL